MGQDGRSSSTSARRRLTRSAGRVRIYRFSDNNRLESVTDARTAEFESPDLWHLREVVKTVLDGDGGACRDQPGGEWRSGVTPTCCPPCWFLRSACRCSVCSTHAAPEREQAKDRTLRNRAVEKWSIRWRHWSWSPWRLPFGYSHNRVGGVSLKDLCRRHAGHSFYALNGLASNLGPSIHGRRCSVPRLLGNFPAAGGWHDVGWVERR